VDVMPPTVERAAARNKIHVLYVGRVTPTKGLRFVLRALARLDGKIDWRLTVVGDGPDMDVARKLAAGLSGKVEFLGWLPRREIDAHYADADVFCFPSLKEAGGNVVLEAMSHGLPVVVCDRGGPATTVTPECGSKIPARGVDGLVAGVARALRVLATSPGLRLRMGAAARDRVCREYLWDAKCRRILGVYHDVLREERERRQRISKATKASRAIVQIKENGEKRWLPPER